MNRLPVACADDFSILVGYSVSLAPILPRFCVDGFHLPLLNVDGLYFAFTRCGDDNNSCLASILCGDGYLNVALCDDGPYLPAPILPLVCVLVDGSHFASLAYVVSYDDETC